MLRKKMGKEIERKFLVVTDSWKKGAVGESCRQGYLVLGKETIVRIRTFANKGYLTIKGRTIGITRLEYEYEIPLLDAEQMMENLCISPIIDKTRYKISDHGSWEIDEFHGANQGLIIAEIELDNENDDFQKPDWIGAEVSSDSRFYNVNLVKNPYQNW